MKKIINLIVLTIAIVLISSCQNKDSKADELWLKQQFKEAVELYENSAEKGSAYAKWRLAKAYLNGYGVDKDKDKGIMLIKQAADDGCEEAKYDIAWAYFSGSLGLKKDEVKGKKLISELCEKTDNAYCRSLYAFNILIGNGFEKDEKKAISILDSVKDKGNPMYLVVKATLFEYGTEDEMSDKKKALEYYIKAYLAGEFWLASNIGRWYYTGVAGSSNVGEAVKWFEEGIKLKDPECMFWLADICLNKNPETEAWFNVARGVELLEKAGRLGHKNAYAWLGSYYLEGYILEKNDEKAYEYLLKSEAQNSSLGTNDLGAMYFDGIGCEKDVKKAIALWQKAAKLGSGRACNNLYQYYYKVEYGDPHKTDYDSAKYYLQRAADLGDVYGIRNLGFHYYNGSVLFQKDLFQSFRYLKKAADMGDIDAAGRVANMYAKGIGTDRDPNKAKEYKNRTIATSDLEKAD